MNTVTGRTCAGLFLISLTTLMYEVLLTRIFSVTMWFHFAFAAISLAMFGITAGAVIVYLCPDYFRQEKSEDRLVLNSFLFSAAIIISIIAHIYIPFNTSVISYINLFYIALTFIIISIPFIFSGICITVMFTCLLHI